MKNIPNAEDCLLYIKNELNIELYDFQKRMIIAWFNGKKVATCRGAGRTFCKNLVRSYLNQWTDTLDFRDDVNKPDVKITLSDILQENPNLYKEDTLNMLKTLNLEKFKREFELDY